MRKRGFKGAIISTLSVAVVAMFLLLIVLTEPSGSIRHRIADVRRKRGNSDWIVSIETIVPEIGTDDMASWHLFLEVQMGKVITAEDIVHINSDNDWRTIGHDVFDGE